MAKQAQTVKKFSDFKPKPPQPPARAKIPAGLGRKAGPVKLRKAAKRQYGPKILHRAAETLLATDWSIPPIGFMGAHVSASEWMIYVAMSFVTGDPPDPKRPPYIGGVTWAYQSPISGGRLERGGQVCDFMVHQPGSEEMCIRLQSERFHVQANHRKVQQDLYLKTHTRGTKIVDLYEQDYIGDKSLRSACRVVANALAGREIYNPALFGTSRRVRP